MKFSLSTLALIASSTSFGPAAAQDCGGKLVCQYVETAPTLDANHAEWADVQGLSTDLLKYTGAQYDGGKASFKCMYDDTKIYFALEVPGLYRFNATENHECAAIGTMMKIGADATFMDMGGCPDIGDCESTDIIPATCDSYLVDIGAHWELRTTERGLLYEMEPDSGTGNDIVANKDDEVGVSQFCRVDDKDDDGVGNEWSGAWDHSNPTDGEDGTYAFELSRLLSTASVKTDTQLSAGETYSFGIAFWDPNQLESGWTKSGHYLTGCGTEWIDLELAAQGGTGTSAGHPISTGAVFISTIFLGLLSMF